MSIAAVDPTEEEVNNAFLTLPKSCVFFFWFFWFFWVAAAEGEGDNIDSNINSSCSSCNCCSRTESLSTTSSIMLGR